MTRLRGWHLLAVGVFLALPCAPGHRALAQRAVVIRVHVADSARRALADVDVAIVRGLNEEVQRGTTDRSGNRTFVLAGLTGSVQAVARRVGFVPARKFVPIGIPDTIQVELLLSRVAQQLDTIVVSAQTAKRLRTHIGADDIAASDRPLLDAFDVMRKLRPFMTREPPDLTGNCLPSRNLWVAGRRILLAPVTGMAEEIKRHPGEKTLASELPVDLLSALLSIRPEHIEDIEYHDCMDTSIGKNGDTGAIFVTLKEGVAFEPGAGSYVIGVAAQDSLLKRITRQPLPGTLPAYRRRVVGVFDQETGAPVIGADLAEVTTGNRVAASETGTASLAFMQQAGRVVISKSGYRPDTLMVKFSPADTLPITILLHKQP